MSNFSLRTRRQTIWLAVLFLSCATFFVERGPYRAIRFSTTGDFSTVYAAARCWLHGTNPYQREALKAELRQAGAPSDLERDQDINPSVYLPAALPWAAAIAWMPWVTANTIWCLLSVGLFALSLWKILAASELSRTGRWAWASAGLLFSPTYVGIYDGNPAVLSISLVALSICFATEAAVIPTGVLLGIASCFKPQIAVCAIGVLALWKRWPPLLAAAAVFLCSTAAGVSVVSKGGHDWRWWAMEQHNVAISFLPGGQSDPTPRSHVAWQLLNAQTLSAYLFGSSRLTDISVWIFALLLLAVFLHFRARSPIRQAWLDVAFLAALTLVITYHRYYDAQLLLLLIPLLVLYWKQGHSKLALASGACLLALEFPLQSIFERRLGPAALSASPAQFALLRMQPLAVLMLSCLLAFGYALYSRGSIGEPAERET